MMAPALVRAGATGLEVDMRSGIIVNQGLSPDLHRPSLPGYMLVLPPHPHCLPQSQPAWVPLAVLRSGVVGSPGVRLSGPILVRACFYVAAFFEVGVNLQHSLLWGLAVIGPQEIFVESQYHVPLLHPRHCSKHFTCINAFNPPKKPRY